MGRPPIIPAEMKTRVVLSVLAGEVTIAEAARREKISEQSIGRWKADFLEERERLRWPLASPVRRRASSSWRLRSPS